jgi:hypothetical protein
MRTRWETWEGEGRTGKPAFYFEQPGNSKSARWQCGYEVVTTAWLDKLR